MPEGKITEIVEWAQNEENIRMAVLEGSLARNTKTDDLADIEAEVIVSEGVIVKLSDLLQYCSRHMTKE